MPPNISPTDRADLEEKDRRRSAFLTPPSTTAPSPPSSESPEIEPAGFPAPADALAGQAAQNRTFTRGEVSEISRRYPADGDDDGNGNHGNYDRNDDDNDQKPTLLIISNKVYDVTSYLPSHPGGGHFLHPLSGLDATVAFALGGTVEHVHTSRAKRLLDGMFIGEITEGQRMSRAQLMRRMSIEESSLLLQKRQSHERPKNSLSTLHSSGLSRQSSLGGSCNNITENSSSSLGSLGGAIVGGGEGGGGPPFGDGGVASAAVTDSRRRRDSALSADAAEVPVSPLPDEPHGGWDNGRDDGSIYDGVVHGGTTAARRRCSSVSESSAESGDDYAHCYALRELQRRRRGRDGGDNGKGKKEHHLKEDEALLPPSPHISPGQLERIRREPPPSSTLPNKYFANHVGSSSHPAWERRSPQRVKKRESTLRSMMVETTEILLRRLSSCSSGGGGGRGRGEGGDITDGREEHNNDPNLYRQHFQSGLGLGRTGPASHGHYLDPFPSLSDEEGSDVMDVLDVNDAENSDGEPSGSAVAPLSFPDPFGADGSGDDESDSEDASNRSEGGDFTCGVPLTGGSGSYHAFLRECERQSREREWQLQQQRRQEEGQYEKDEQQMEGAGRAPPTAPSVTVSPFASTDADAGTEGAVEEASAANARFCRRRRQEQHAQRGGQQGYNPQPPTPSASSSLASPTMSPSATSEGASRDIGSQILLTTRLFPQLKGSLAVLHDDRDGAAASAAASLAAGEGPRRATVTFHLSGGWLRRMATKVPRCPGSESAGGEEEEEEAEARRIAEPLKAGASRESFQCCGWHLEVQPSPPPARRSSVGGGNEPPTAADWAAAVETTFNVLTSSRYSEAMALMSAVCGVMASRIRSRPPPGGGERRPVAAIDVFEWVEAQFGFSDGMGAEFVNALVDASLLRPVPHVERRHPQRRRGSWAHFSSRPTDDDLSFLFQFCEPIAALSRDPSLASMATDNSDNPNDAQCFEAAGIDGPSAENFDSETRLRIEARLQRRRSSVSSYYSAGAESSPSERLWGVPSVSLSEDDASSMGHRGGMQRRRSSIYFDALNAQDDVLACLDGVDAKGESDDVDEKERDDDQKTMHSDRASQNEKFPGSSHDRHLCQDASFAYPCFFSDRDIPCEPAMWPQMPLLLRPTPGSGTRIRGIRYASRKGSIDGSSFCSGCTLPINTGREERGRCLVVDFETRLFRGSIMVRIRSTEKPGDANVYDGSDKAPATPQGFFEGTKRTFQVVVSGHFKEGNIPITECVTGQAFNRKAGSMQSRWVIRSAVNVITLLSPQLKARWESDAAPSFLSPLASTAQCVVVDEGGKKEGDDEASNLEDDLVEPSDSTSLMAEIPNLIPSDSSNPAVRRKVRKEAFDKLYSDRVKGPTFRTDKVYTFEFYQQLLNFDEFSIDLGSLGRHSLDNLLNGQPLKIMAAHQKDEGGEDRGFLDCLWSFDLWHEKLYPMAKMHADHKSY